VNEKSPDRKHAVKTDLPKNRQKRAAEPLRSGREVMKKKKRGSGLKTKVKTRKVDLAEKECQKLGES